MSKPTQRSPWRASATNKPMTATGKNAISVERIHAFHHGRSITSAELGKHCEELVFDFADIWSDGQIVIYPPRTDVEGTDAIFKRKFRAAALMSQIKGRKSQRPSGAFELSIDGKTLPVGDPKLIIVVHYDPKRRDGKVVVWLIWSKGFRKLASFSAGQYQAVLSPNPKARDRWVPYRHEIREIADLLLQEIKANEKRRRRTK